MRNDRVIESLRSELENLPHIAHRELRNVTVGHPPRSFRVKSARTRRYGESGCVNGHNGRFCFRMAPERRRRSPPARAARGPLWQSRAMGVFWHPFADMGAVADDGEFVLVRGD